MEKPLTLLLEARDAAQGGRARRLRQAAGVSQAEIARTVGVDPSCLSRWEAGRRRPGGDAAVRWALVLRDLAAYLGSSFTGSPTSRNGGKKPTTHCSPG
jgi:DNA-binding transcriptional regulator YiaG